MTALSLRGFRLPPWASVRHDLIAGLVVGIVALPLSIALAVAVGVPPIAGLYTAAFAGGAAAIFGGSSYNITGPTAALVPILAHTVAHYGIVALPMAGLMAGVILLAMSALKFGRLMRFMPGLVVVGFTAGIALSIAFGQLNNFLAVKGTDPSLERFHEKTWDTMRHLSTLGLTTPLIAFASIAILLAWPQIPRVRRIPGALVAVVALTALTWSMGIHTPTLGSRYGALPSSLPKPSFRFFDASLIVDLLPAAFSIAILGSIESLLSAVVADGMSPLPQRHNANRELFGQGIANLVAPIMGGVPATAAIARTATGIRNGATSRLTGVFHAVTVLVATLLLGGLAGHIPLATLSAILLVVAWNIAEVPEVIALLRRAPREDLIVLVSTITITLFFDLSYAIAFGVLVSAVLLIRRLSELPAAQELLPDDSGRIPQVSSDLGALIQSRPDISFFSAQGMLSFHSAAAFEYELGYDAHRPLILRMKDVHHVDTSGLLTLEGIIKHRRRRGARIILTAIQPSIMPALRRFGLLEMLGPENVFEHTRCAIESIDQPDGHAAHPHALAIA